MEMLDIVDERGIPTGVIKERTKIHEDGDLHRTSHVWIVRDNNKSGKDILLQKRSKEKDSFPGCYDISSAGHIPAGDGFLESALRELKEELGIDAQGDDLIKCGIRKISMNSIFHGKEFNDNQITIVYILRGDNIHIDDLILQEEEVESVMWIDFDECVEAVKKNIFKHCIYMEELEMIKEKFKDK